MADNGYGVTLSGQPNAGLPGDKSVFDGWVNAPTSGKAAKTAVDTRNKAKGTAAPPSVDLAATQYANRDYIRIAADKASMGK